MWLLSEPRELEELLPVTPSHDEIKNKEVRWNKDSPDGRVAAQVNYENVVVVKEPQEVNMELKTKKYDGTKTHPTPEQRPGRPEAIKGPANYC